MKIMTFNIQHCENYLTQKIDYNAMADVIKKCGAEIVGLNEIRSKGNDPEFQDQAAALSELTGLKSFYFAKAIDIGDNNPYGNAILSKFNIKSAETIMIPDPEPKTGDDYYETRCILKVKFDNSLTVMVVHFGLNKDEQENAVDAIMKNLEDEKCILMGDFNALPDNTVLTPIREKMKDAADCFERDLFSFPSDNPNIKIDYIFVTPDIEVTEADIPEFVVSDHRPHTATVLF